MDQTKTNLPNTKHVAKSTSALWRLRTHVTGVLVHTRAPHGKLAFVFVDLLQFPHDSNLTITLLLRSLVSVCQQQQLSENLYIQMDNTSRENKNRYVLAFCALLVKLKIFNKVYMTYKIITMFKLLIIIFYISMTTGAVKFPTCRPYSRGCGSAFLQDRRRNQACWM